jgi:hypothetical protein
MIAANRASPSLLRRRLALAVAWSLIADVTVAHFEDFSAIQGTKGSVVDGVEQSEDKFCSSPGGDPEQRAVADQA